MKKSSSSRSVPKIDCFPKSNGKFAKFSRLSTQKTVKEISENNRKNLELFVETIIFTSKRGLSFRRQRDNGHIGVLHSIEKIQLWKFLGALTIESSPVTSNCKSIATCSKNATYVKLRKSDYETLGRSNSGEMKKSKLIHFFNCFGR